MAPNASALRNVLQAISCFLIQHMSLLVTPRQLSCLLGTMQWHCLPDRLVLSVFHAGYGLVRSKPQDVAVLLERDVLLELRHFALIAPLLAVRRICAVSGLTK